MGQDNSHGSRTSRSKCRLKKMLPVCKALRLESLGIPLCTLNEKSIVDVAIDGADEVDPALALVKAGGGGTLHQTVATLCRTVPALCQTVPTLCPTVSALSQPFPRCAQPFPHCAQPFPTP